MLACGGGAVDRADQGCLLVQESTFLLLKALIGVPRDYLLRPGGFKLVNNIINQLGGGVGWWNGGH